MFTEAAGKDPPVELDLVQMFRVRSLIVCLPLPLTPDTGCQATVKFAKLLEDGRRLENLSWRLTFRGLAPPCAHDSDSKRINGQIKTLAPEFADGVLLRTTVAPDNLQEGTFRKRKR